MSPTRQGAACTSDSGDRDSGKGAAGKWTDAATGEHGDLLDLIAMNRRLDRMRDVLDEARLFLSLPRPKPQDTQAIAANSDWVAQIRASAVRRGTPDCGHARRNLPASARHHSGARTERAALSPSLLLPP